MKSLSIPGPWPKQLPLLQHAHQHPVNVWKTLSVVCLNSSKWEVIVHFSTHMTSFSFLNRLQSEWAKQLGTSQEKERTGDVSLTLSLSLFFDSCSLCRTYTSAVCDSISFKDIDQLEKKDALPSHLQTIIWRLSPWKIPVGPSFLSGHAHQPQSTFYIKEVCIDKGSAL